MKSNAWKGIIMKKVDKTDDTVEAVEVEVDIEEDENISTMSEIDNDFEINDIEDSIASISEIKVDEETIDDINNSIDIFSMPEDSGQLVYWGLNETYKILYLSMIDVYISEYSVERGSFSNTTRFTSEEEVPWDSHRDSIEIVSVRGGDLICESMAYWFKDCVNIKTISNIMSNNHMLTDVSYMFSGCESLITVNISANNNITNMTNFCDGCSELEFVNTVSHIAETEVIKALDDNGFSDAFSNCPKKEEFDNTIYWYYGNDEKTNIHLSSIEPTDSHYIAGHFIDGDIYTNISMLPIDNENVEKIVIDNAISIKNDCSKEFIANISKNATMIENIENIDTSDATDFSMMFNECIITSLDLSNFDMSSATTIYSMFYNCNDLVEINLTDWDTSQVTDMSYLFYGCNSLNIIDISSFDVSNVENIDFMFYECENLVTIYATNDMIFSDDVYANSEEVFTDCVSLVGGMGTNYTSLHKNAEYAHIDSITNPGYFTLQGQVTEMVIINFVYYDTLFYNKGNEN